MSSPHALPPADVATMPTLPELQALRQQSKAPIVRAFMKAIETELKASAERGDMRIAVMFHTLTTDSGEVKLTHFVARSIKATMDTRNTGLVVSCESYSNNSDWCAITVAEPQ